MGIKEDILGAGSNLAIGDVRAEASVNEEHTVEGDVTSHPVERGIDVTDNYRVKPRELSISGIISNTPLAVGYPLQTAIDGIRNIAAGNDQPVDEAWNELQRYFDESEVITIETSLKEYENMVLTSLTVIRNSQNGQNLSFSIRAREVQFATATLAPAFNPKTERGQKSKDKGRDTNSESTKEQGKKAKSALAKTDDAVGGKLSGN